MTAFAASSETPARLWLEAPLARIMFWLAVLFLIVLGGLLHRHKLPDPDQLQNPAVIAQLEDEGVNPFTPELQIQLWMLAGLWPLFCLEGLWRFLQAPAGTWWRPLRDLLIVSLVPPWRMAQRSQGPGRQLWLPGFGWRTVEHDLRRDLERAFGWPMIFIALLVLPLLVAEFFFHKQMHQHFWLEFLVEAGNALVWFAFTLEFIIMLAVAKHRFRYALANWITLAIILLPFLHFLPLFRVLRLSRVLRLEQLARLGRLYRMQGLALRGWRAFLLLQLIQRLIGTSPERQLEQLRDLEQAKLEELDDLRQEIAQLEEAVARRQAATQRTPQEMEDRP